MEAVADITNPFGGGFGDSFGHHNHHYGGGFGLAARVEGEIIAAEVVAADINMMERDRLRQMEMAGAYGVPPGGVGPYYPPVLGYGVRDHEIY